MKISARLNNVIDRYLLYPSAITGSLRRVDINDNPANSLFLNIKSDSDKIEIPVFLYDTAIDYIKHAGGKFNTDIIIPLNYSFCNNYRTVDSILGYLLASSPRLDEEIRKNSSEKYGTYYGGRGIILNENKRILFITMIVGSIIDNRIIWESSKMYVNPLVSVAETGLEKTIYTKIVPKCITENIQFYTSLSYDSHKVDIVFKDITDELFITPNIPDEDYQDRINNLLVDNIDDIVDIAFRCR